METTDADIIVVGAGIFGIAGARTYLQVHPKCKLIILDQDCSVGGTWNARRNYSSFWTQTGLRMTEFCDMPMKLPQGEETYYDTFKAKHVTTYLEEYTNKHIYAGRSLHDRIIFNFRVDSLEKIDDEFWELRGTHLNKEGLGQVFRTPKVMVASGMTSQPNMPSLPNSSTFQGQIIHSESFGQSSFLLSPKIKDIAVLGGGKSSADMVYASAKAGKSVHWIIRNSGSGPAAFIDIKGRGPYANAAEIGSTRLMSTMAPSCWAKGEDLKSSFVHKTKLGRMIEAKIWRNADRDIRDEADYQGRAQTREGFEKLATNTIAFWCNGPVGLLQHRDFWPTIASSATVHRKDISTLTPTGITFTDNTTIPCAALLCGTGWAQTYPFLTPHQLCELGLPHPTTCQCLDDPTGWEVLQAAADAQVLSQYPKLAHPPDSVLRNLSPRITSSSKTPYRLYKLIAPLDDADSPSPSIAFLGQIKTTNNFRVAECQALWATAYFDNNLLDPPDYDDMQADVAYVNAWCRRRYPATGAAGNYMHYDAVTYTDALLEEVGVGVRRKRGWWRGLVEPVWAGDLRGCVEGYIERVRREGAG